MKLKVLKSLQLTVDNTAEEHTKRGTLVVGAVYIKDDTIEVTQREARVLQEEYADHFKVIEDANGT